MVKKGMLDVPVIGVASSKWTVDDLRDRARDSITEYGGGIDDEAAFEKLTGAAALRRRRLQRRRRRSRRAQEGARRTRRARRTTSRSRPACSRRSSRGSGRRAAPTNARVIVEKPFGRDLESAQELNRVLHSVFPEQDIFRIDHYLGKEAMQNIIYFRFANSFLEPIWNRNYVALGADHDGGGLRRAGPRGKFYEEVGALRDVIENHLFQTVALLAMEPPVGPGVEELRDAKERVFDAMRDARARRPRARAVRGLPRRGRASRPTPTSRRSPPCACTSTRGAGPACRSTSAPGK